MDFNKAAENDFRDAELEELRAYCDHIKLEYHPNMNADTLRKKLTAAMGEYRELSGDEPGQPLVVPSQQAEIRALVGLNLKPTGRWEGRRRRITLHRSLSHDNTSRPQFFAWGRLHVYVPFGVECSVPYPIFNILKDTTGQKLERKRTVDDEGRIFYRDVWIPSQRFMYADHGDDPDTVRLPESEIDRIARLHRLTDGFAGFSERQYRAICTTLRLTVPVTSGIPGMRGAIEARCGIASSPVDLSTPERTVAA